MVFNRIFHELLKRNENVGLFSMSNLYSIKKGKFNFL